MRNIGLLLQMSTAVIALAFGACATPDGSSAENLSSLGC